jgi:8-oxo-dGTP diphosphatase
MSEKPFALSVKMVVRDAAGQCLLLRRSLSSKGNPGKWDLPGGKAELGEKFDEALLREVVEETGLMVSITRVAGSAQFELPARKIAYIIMEGRAESGDVRLSSEHDQFAWVARREMLTMDLAEQFVPFAESYVAAGE